MNHVSIWSNNYELKDKTKEKSQRWSFRNAVSSFITTGRKQILPKESLKDEFIPSKSDNILDMESNNTEYQNESENILDIYNCQDTKLTASYEQESKQTLYLKNDTSPELSKQRNPFVKRVSELMTSPSVLSSGNYRQRGRNLMRIRRTIIDENTIVESRYFSKKNNEEHDTIKSSDSTENVNSESSRCDIIADVNTDMHNLQSRTSHEKVGLAEDKVTAKNLDDALSTNHDESLSNAYENEHDKSCSDNKINEISSTIQYTKINNDYVLDNASVSSNSSATPVDNLINREDMDTCQGDLRKWSNTKSCQVTPHKKIDHFKRRSTPNLVNILLCKD